MTAIQSRPIGFVDSSRTVQSSQQAHLLPEERTDAILRFDGGETAALADLLHVCLVLGTTGSGKTTSVLLPALNGLIGRGFGGLVVDVKGSMAPAVRAIAARHGRAADVIEIGPHETAEPIDLLAGADAHRVSELFRALFMSHAAGDDRNQSFHMAGLAQAVDAWQVLSRRCRDAGEPFSLAALDRMLNEPEFAARVFSAFQGSFHLSPAEEELARHIAGAPAHVVPAEAKNATQRVWREQVTYDMGVVRTGLRLFRASPGLERRFFAPGGAPLDMERWIYDDRLIVVLRFSPATGEAGAGIARHVLRAFYQAVYDRGLGLPDGQCTFLCADEFQDFISTDPADALNDAAFVAKVREFRCATMLGTQSAIALAQRAHRGLGDVRTILGNCNVRIFLYSDEPETVGLAPANETPLDELGPGQAVLVHYDAAVRTHRHATTGVNGMHASLVPVLAGASCGKSRIASPAPDGEDAERERQNILAGLGCFARRPSSGVTASAFGGRNDEIVEETPAEAAKAILQSLGAGTAGMPKDSRAADGCHVLHFVPDAMKSPALCLEAVRQDGMALAAVPAWLLTPEICLEAVRQNGLALEFVPKQLRTMALCLEAVRSSGWAIKFVPEALKTPKFCLEAVRRSPGAAQFVPNGVPASAGGSVPAAARHPRTGAGAGRSGGSRLVELPCRPQLRRHGGRQIDGRQQGATRQRS